MKNHRSMLGLAILLALSLEGVACNKGLVPLAPEALSSSQGTPTPVIGAGVSQIYWYSASLSRTNILGSVSTDAEVYLSVSGQAETTALVILTGGSAPLTLPYNQSLVIGNNTYARYYQSSSAFVYRPGTSYTLSTVTSAGTAWTTVTAPGGISCAADGSSCSWSVEGTNDNVFVETSGYSGTYDSLNTQTDINSVFNVPSMAYPSGGSYYVRTTCQANVTTVNNAMPGSALEAYDLLWSSINR